MTSLDISSNDIGGYNTHFEGHPHNKFIATPEGPRAIADALKHNVSETFNLYNA